jgi:hypothetical protein
LQQLIERGLDWSSSNVGTANYGGLEFQERPIDVKGLTREQMMIDALNEWKGGTVGHFFEGFATKVSPEADGLCSSLPPFDWK